MRYSLITLLCLAACGGGGGSGTTAAQDLIADLPTTITPEPDPAPTGNASYRGPMSLVFTPQTAQQVTFNGTLSMTVDFDATTDAITGDAGDFTTPAGGQAEGQLFLSGGALDDRGAALLMTSQVSGSLRSGDTGYLVFGFAVGRVP